MSDAFDKAAEKIVEGLCDALGHKKPASVQIIRKETGNIASHLRSTFDNPGAVDGQKLFTTDDMIAAARTSRFPDGGLVGKKDDFFDEVAGRIIGELEFQLNEFGWTFDSQGCNIAGLLRDTFDDPRGVAGYEDLARILDRAYDQSARGKGRERHANDKPFRQQPIMEIARMVGLGGHAYQICKKTQEAVGMANRGDSAAAIAEFYGAIVYSAAAVLLIEETMQQIDSDQHHRDHF